MLGCDRELLMAASRSAIRPLVSFELVVPERSIVLEATIRPRHSPLHTLLSCMLKKTHN